jgi:hypothetical protein
MNLLSKKLVKADFYLSREGKPTGTLLIIAFEAAKISKPVTQTEIQKTEADLATS